LETSKNKQAGIKLDDDMVANLEHYLSLAESPDLKTNPLLDQIMEALENLEARLLVQAREMRPNEEYQQISAATQAVQAAALAMQLYSAGRQYGRQ
jgi:hypothetical protein